MQSNAIADFNHIIESVPHIHDDRQYWFIRTEGGSLYEAFIENNLIGIGYTNISLKRIYSLPDLALPKRLERIKKLVKSRYNEFSQPGVAASNISKFLFEIQKGDVVVIPSPASQLLTFGIVKDDSVTEMGSEKAERLIGYKTRRIQWIKTLSRDNLPPRLYRLFFSHQAVVSGNEYAEYIDNILNDFYVKDEKIHLQVKIQKQDEILAKDLFKACLGLLEITDDFLEAHDVQGSTSDIEVKVTVNSPGVVEFIGLNFQTLIILGFTIVALAGGGIEGKILGQEISFKTDGILKKLSDFLKEHKKRKLISQLAKQLDIQNPDDAVKVITKLIE